MLIDDDDTICELVSAVLGDEGYKVVAVPDAAGGLAALRAATPKLVLLDSLTHGLAHAEFVTEYRKLPGPHAPIYLFTAASNADTTVKELGLAGVLAKPFDIRALLELAERHGCEKQDPGRSS
ncbi:MAG TPA: response regulator [Chloroflexota bacterium]|nr:response regulator [Chloroflexota bacterium]